MIASLSHRRPARRAFTLLEVALAISLSVVLITALYLTLNLHYHHARLGRETIDETNLLRSVVDRVAQDIACELPAIDPSLQSSKGGSSSGGGSGSGSGGAGSSPSSPNTGSGSGSAGSSSSGGSTPSTGSSSGGSTTNNSVVINLQVYGESSHLVLTGRGVPKDLTQSPRAAPTQTSDLRRVTYWLVEGKGLARQEITQVTGPDATAASPPTLPPAVGNADSYIIAPQVKAFSLEYFDGTNWQTSWDGTKTDPATSYPIGPPMAIAFTVTVEVPGHGQQKPREVTYRHVVAIPTANSPQAAAQNPTSSSP